MTDPDKRKASLVDIAVPIVLLLCFFVIYLGSVDIHSKGYTWNFLFDADPNRVIKVFTDKEWPSGDVSKHPLYVILFKPVTRLLNTIIHDPSESTLIVTALISALSVLFAYLIFLKFLRQKLEAFLFAVMFGCSSSVWFFSSITETFSVSSAMIVFAFYAQTLQIPAQDHWRMIRFHVAYVLYSLAAVGTAITNMGYSFLGYANFLRKRRQQFVPFTASIFIYVVVVVLLLMACSQIQHRFYPKAFVFSSPKSFVDAFATQKKSGWVRTSPDFLLNAAHLYTVCRTALVDNIVGPKVISKKLSPPFVDRYRGRMLDLSPQSGPLYIIAVLLYFSAFIGSLAIFIYRALRGKDDKDAQLAVGFILLSFLLQVVLYHRTAPLIYSVPAAFCLIFLIMHGYRQVRLPFKRLALFVLTLLMVANNYFFIATINMHLRRPAPQKPVYGDVQRSP